MDEVVPAMEGDRSKSGDRATGNEAMDYDFVAYRLRDHVPPVVVAGARRSWMDDMPRRAAYRCLPMLMANQAGWFILNTHSVRVFWDGAQQASSVRIEYRAPAPAEPHVVSHFGHGIVTWRIPILFQTSPEFMLLVRGPSNQPKPHVYPLEGLVETDWSTATFTMNWKVLTAREPIVFEEGEPVCMVLPIRKHDLERFSPRSLPIQADATLADKFAEWKLNRDRFLMERKPGAWQKDYFLGREAPPNGHRTRFKLREFREE